MKKIIILNVGSSSCKFQIFTEDLTLLGKGMIDRIGIEGTNTVYKDNNGNAIKENKNFEHKDLAKYLKSFIDENNICDFNDVNLMVHRVVMGSELFTENIVIKDKETIKRIKDLTPLAPLHQPFNVLALEEFFEKYEHITHVVVFDTTFHTTILDENFIYPIPLEFYEDLKIRKYGAHGSSHLFITEQMKEINKKDKVNFINLHIGNGASACLIKDSKSIDTSMGLTPLAGLMMGTRSGDVDPSVIFYLVNQKGYSIKDVEEIFIKKSGLLGVSGKSSDMRDIITEVENGNKRADLARRIFAKKIKNYIAMYLNELENVDGIVFTGGIGENDFELIEDIFKNFNAKKIILNKKITNKEDINLISSPKSKVNIYIIKTNEELQMAKIAKRLINIK